MTAPMSPHLPPGQLLFSPVEAGPILGVSRWTVQRYCETGELRATKVRGRWRIPRAALLARAEITEGEASA